MILVVVAVLSVATLSSGGVVKPQAEDGTFELLLMHTNDIHAMFDETTNSTVECLPEDREADKCFGGIPRVAYVAKQARRAAEDGGPPVLFLNAGDTFTGSSWFSIYTWRVAAEFINALQFDAISLGNHEFDKGEDSLVNFIRNLSTPVLAANLNFDKTLQLKSLNNIYKSIIIVKNGIKIGIIGYVTPTTTLSAIKNNVEFEEEKQAIRREIANLKNQDVKIFIALGHSGYEYEKEIAKDVEDLDLVVGGHSHTLLTNNKTITYPQVEGDYPTKVKQANGRTVWVVQAYAFTRYMGELHVTFDSHGEVIDCYGDPILLDQNIPRDPEVLEINKRYRSDEKIIEYNKVVGTTLVFLDNTACRNSECNLGDFIADSMLNYTKIQHPEANIAILNGGSIRSSMEPGQTIVRYKDIKATILPYTAPLKLATINGTILKLSLENSVSQWTTNAPKGYYMQFSGMNVTYDLEKPVGSRVKIAKAICSNCGNKMFDIKEHYEYNVIMSKFLSQGGDGYSMFVGLPMVELGYTDADCVLDSFKKYSPVNSQLDGRITNLNEFKISKK